MESCGEVRIVLGLGWKGECSRLEREGVGEIVSLGKTKRDLSLKGKNCSFENVPG